MKNVTSSSRSLSQIEGQLSHGQTYCNGSHIDSPLKLFSKAKNEIIKIFQEIGVYLGEASSFLQEKCFVSEEFANEIDKYSEEVKMS